MGSNMSGMGGMSLSLNIGTSLGASAKPALLSPSQKKANHIQSEQKRRANIRRGYDALCTAVPTLREAIAQQEKEEAMQRAEDAAVVAANGGRRPAQRRKRVKGAKEVIVKEEEKIDGRAGPKSEYVVLQKSMFLSSLFHHRTNTNQTFSQRSTMSSNCRTSTRPCANASPPPVRLSTCRRHPHQWVMPLRFGSVNGPVARSTRMTQRIRTERSCQPSPSLDLVLDTSPSYQP
jgi:hypothetical protein